MREFDVVVLGAGAAGEVTAGRLGQNGLSVAIVEQALVGGDCSYYACMPSKALLRPVELANEVRRVPGLEVSPIDVAAVLRRRDEVIHDLDDSAQLPWLEQHGVTLVRGRGRLSGELTIDVEGQEPLVARRAVVVATGSTATVPDIPGLREAQPWTSREATTAKAVPARLAILGGGVVGVEMAQAFGALGSHVTLIHRGERLIAREEPFAGEQVLASLRELGVDVRLRTSVTRVGARRIALARARRRLRGRGRRAARRGRAHARHDPASASRSSACPRTSRSRSATICACPATSGCSRSATSTAASQLTHMGKYQGRLVADAILGREVRLRSDGARSPRVIFTDPQVGAVGLTLADAQAAGIRVRHVDVEHRRQRGRIVHRPRCAGHLADRRRRGAARHRGRHDHRAEVAEALHAATIAVVAEVSLDDLWHAVPSFPTRSELWLRLLEAYGL